MLDPATAVDHALRSSSLRTGAFYGSSVGLSLGVGLIYRDVTYPLFNLTDRLFDTVSGPVYILSHECDLDRLNNRHFNDFVLVCPVLPMKELLASLSSEHDDKIVERLVGDVAANRVSRVFFLPPYVGSNRETILEHGAFLYLNQISNAHISEFDQGRAVPLCALSVYGATHLDWKLQNHLLRAKVEQLPRLT